MIQANVHDAFEHLLVKTSLTPQQVRAMFAAARDPAFWMKMNPRMSISTGSIRSRRGLQAHAISDSEFRCQYRRMENDGYFALRRALPAAVVRRARRAIETVRQNGWPPIFAGVYDEYWEMVRTPVIKRMLNRTLGSGFRQIPRLWVHCVEPSPGHHGWSPHVDGPDGSNCVSIWLALSDATLENGCMYLVPRSGLPPGVGSAFRAEEALSSSDYRRLLQHSHALPATAGSILGWDFGVIHWGAMAVAGPEPRISVAFEFAAKEANVDPTGKPLLDANALPAFEQRLAMIGKALLAYRKFEPMMARYAALAEALLTVEGGL